jgi:hypothetical protein
MAGSGSPWTTVSKAEADLESAEAGDTNGGNRMALRDIRSFLVELRLVWGIT